MIAGLETPTAGDVIIGDRRVNDVAPGERDIAMVSQHHALYPHMTVHDNMAFGLRMRGTHKAEIDRRVQEAAEILSLVDYLDRYPKALSGGQQQRAALGRAIVRDPQVFVFDEPLSHLDAHLRVQMRNEISRLHRRSGTTIVYVTHDQVEAMTLGDRIVLMNHGVTQQVATPLEIYNRPANQFVATCVGSPAMNLFGGDVREGTFHPGCSAALEPIPIGDGIPDGSVVLGIRPEDLLVGEPGVPFGAATVEMIEPLGHETMVHFDLEGRRCVARVGAKCGVTEGATLQLNVRQDSMHLFAADEHGDRLN